MIPDKSELHQLGYFTKLHGYKGELTAFLDTEDWSDYEDIETVFIELKGQLVPYFIETLEYKTNTSVKVKLEGIDSEELAKTLVKARIFIKKEEISEEDETRLELRALQGYQVNDAVKGDIGHIEQVLELAGNPQLEIKYKNKIILLPLHEDFIKEIDHKKKLIKIEAPEGLIDLYL